MPQIVLEHSANIDCDEPIAQLLGLIHSHVHTIAGVDPANCKSRRYRCEDFRVGEADPASAFVHLDVRFVEGRSDAVKNRLGEALLDCLRQSFATSATDAVQLTVEVRDILLKDYHKFPAGTLTAQ